MKHAALLLSLSLSLALPVLPHLASAKPAPAPVPVPSPAPAVFTASPAEPAVDPDDGSPLPPDTAAWGRPIGQRLAADSAVNAPPFTFRWPLDSVDISSNFGMRVHPVEGIKKMHKGVDLRGPEGTRVLSTGPGRVTRAGFRNKLGRYVAVAHPNGFISIYGHLSEILVHPGMRVRAGSILGLVGATGKVTGPHLHFTLYREDVTFDPLLMVGRKSDAPNDATLLP